MPTLTGIPTPMETQLAQFNAQVNPTGDEALRRGEAIAQKTAERVNSTVSPSHLGSQINTYA